MDKNFRKEYAAVKNAALLQANAYFFANMEEIVESFQNALEAACCCVKELQAQGLQEMEYMELTMLRTRLLEHDYRAPIMVYDSSWYGDTKQFQAGEADVGCIFSFYETMMKDTEAIAKKYQAKLSGAIVKECMCEAAEHFWEYAAIAWRQAVMGFSPEGMGITEDFRIRVCEYMGFGEVCWRYTPQMTQEQMKKWFGKGEENVYRFRDYRGRDFSGWDMSSLDFTGCDFRGCSLEGSDFSGADLTGAWFCGSSMKGVCLRGAWMPGTRFDLADLKEADFNGAYSTCEINDDFWMRPDNVRASFVGADLQHADFTFSAVENADFTGANMEGVKLNDSHNGFYLLDERQMAQVEFDT